MDTEKPRYAYWACRSCQVQGCDREPPTGGVTCWWCGGPVIVFTQLFGPVEFDSRR